jgi:SPP1 gp7 family putative phage head morphogenesis protein
VANFLNRMLEAFVNLLPENATRSSKEDTGLTIKTSPLLWTYEIFVLEWERRTLLRDLDLMIKQDTRFDRANYVMANAATRGGISVTIDKAMTDKVKQRAQEITDKFMKEAKVNAHLPAWGRTVIRDGDIFLNPLFEPNGDGTARIIRIKNLPAITMERLDDMTDNFPDLKQAFMQIDPITRQKIQTFPLWSINHIRWKYEPGERYGRSQYYSARSFYHKLNMTEEDLVVRRRTRAVQRKVHIIGNKENPGNQTEIDKYKQQNSLDDPKKSKITTDYFVNGLGDVKNLEGDAHLDHIADVEYLLENMMIGTGVPLHILGFGRNVNRDIVEDQKDTYKDDVSGLQDLLEHGDPGTFSGLRALINMNLALHGINPEDVSIGIRWAELDEMTMDQTINSVLKLREAQPKPLVTHKLALNMLAKHLDLDDNEAVESELKAIEEEIASDRAAIDVEKQAVNPETAPPPNATHTTITHAGTVTDSKKKELKAANPLRSDKMAEIENETKDMLTKHFKLVSKKTTSEKMQKGLEHLLTSHMKDEKQEPSGETPKPTVSLEVIQAYILHHFDSAWESSDGEFVNKMFSNYQKAIGLAAETVNQDIRNTVDFKLVSEEVNHVLRLKAGERIKGIEDTTKKEITKAIQQAYTNGDDVAGYIRRINEVIEAPVWRLNMIARTEMAYSFNQANLKFQMLAGYTVFKWQAVLDKRTCPRCEARHDQPFNIGSDPPPLHPNCRCILIADT